MDVELEEILTNLSDAGCGKDELEKTKQFYEEGDTETLIRYFRRYRCNLMEKLHESQRKVDCLDFLIRQTVKGKATK